MTIPLRHPTPDAPAAFLRFRERVRARTGTAELLTFESGGERFAFDLRAVDEIVDAPALQEVPDAPPQMVGVCAPARPDDPRLRVGARARRARRPRERRARAAQR